MKTRCMAAITYDEPGFEARWIDERGARCSYFPPAATSPYEVLRWLPHWFPSQRGRTVTVIRIIHARIGCTWTAGPAVVSTIPFLALPAPEPTEFDTMGFPVKKLPGTNRERLLHGEWGGERVEHEEAKAPEFDVVCCECGDTIGHTTCERTATSPTVCVDCTKTIEMASEGPPYDAATATGMYDHY